MTMTLVSFQSRFPVSLPSSSPLKHDKIFIQFCHVLRGGRGEGRETENRDWNDTKVIVFGSVSFVLERRKGWEGDRESSLR